MLKTVLAIALACFAARAQAATDNIEAAAEYQAALTDSMKSISAFLAEPLAKGLAFAAGSQGFSPVQAKPLLGFNLGFGIGAGTTSIDKSGAKASAAQNGADITETINGLPASLPIPLTQVTGHFGLPKLLFFESNDLGLRLLALNAANEDVNVKLNGFGVEFRGNLFEAGLVSPATLTLSLGLDTLSTEIRSTTKAAAYSTSYAGADFAGNTQYLFNVDSQVSVATLKAVVSRKFLFITPYAGAALNVVSGDTTVSMAQKGVLTVTGLPGGPASTSTLIEGKGMKPAPAVEARLGGGLELSFFFLYLSLGGEYGVVSGGAAGYGQLGVQFR